MAVSDDPKELFGLRIAHAGINGKDPEDAKRIAETLAALLGLGTSDVGPSYFVDTAVEVMKQNGRGTNGHIGFHVDDLPAAEAWFKEHGAEFDESSRNVLPDGRTRLIYFAGEIGGFAIHLTID
jgi:catechol 2,3-dioxygenase-like lactoylglutathione lyase family enzyme